MIDGVELEYVEEIGDMIDNGELKHGDESHWYIWGYYTARSNSRLMKFDEISSDSLEDYKRYEMGWYDGEGDRDS